MKQVSVLEPQKMIDLIWEREKKGRIQFSLSPSLYITSGIKSIFTERKAQRMTGKLELKRFSRTERPPEARIGQILFHYLVLFPQWP